MSMFMVPSRFAACCQEFRLNVEINCQPFNLQKNALFSPLIRTFELGARWTSAMTLLKAWRWCLDVVQTLLCVQLILVHCSSTSRTMLCSITGRPFPAPPDQKYSQISIIPAQFSFSVLDQADAVEKLDSGSTDPECGRIPARPPEVLSTPLQNQAIMAPFSALICYRAEL
jgi:hypothetical protein